MFSTETFKNRRNRLRQALPGVSMAFVAHQDSPRNYKANTFEYRQNSHFMYLTGLNNTGLTLLMTPEEDILFGDDATMDDIIWTGPVPPVSELASSCGIGRTLPLSRLQETVKSLHPVHYLPPFRAETVMELARLLEMHPEKVVSGASVELIRAMADVRMIKEEAEIAEIERALDASYAMYRAAAAILKPGLKEHDIMAAMTSAQLQHECVHSFTPIVTVRGEVLHNHHYGNTLAEGNLILLDSGAETASCYASDITRTFPVSGQFTPRQRDVYEIVLQSQLDAISACTPGVSFADAHRVACRTIAAGLVELGLLMGDIDEIVEAGAHALFFPHGLGHILGMDVHDMEDLGDHAGYEPGTSRSSQFGLAFLRFNRFLKPGMVFTVEPGIYFIEALIRQWHDRGEHARFVCYDKVMEYIGFGGIRIEDDILVTETGCRVLGGSPIPKTVTDVESFISGGK